MSSDVIQRVHSGRGEVITLIGRRPASPNGSIEKVFSYLELPVYSCRLRVRTRTVISSRAGACALLLNLAACFWHGSEVTHIIGDIHYGAIVVRGKCILTIHDLRGLCTRTGLGGLLYRWLWFVVPMWRCDAITAISQFTRGELVKAFPWADSKITTIGNPVTIEPDTSQRRWVRDDGLVVLIVGTAPHKRIEYIFAALRGVNAQVIVVGRLSFDQREVCQSLGIRVFERVDIGDRELATLYQQVCLLAFVSSYEGFGLPVIEAQKCGCPVVANDIEVLREVGGDGALFVDAANEEELRDAFYRLYDDASLREELIRNGLANVARFSAERIRTAYLELYEQLASAER